MIGHVHLISKTTKLPQHPAVNQQPHQGPNASPSHANESHKRWSTHWRWSGLGTAGLNTPHQLTGETKMEALQSTRNKDYWRKKHLGIPGKYVSLHVSNTFIVDILLGRFHISLPVAKWRWAAAAKSPTARDHFSLFLHEFMAELKVIMSGDAPLRWDGSAGCWGN